MIERYNDTKIVNTKYQSTIYPTIPTILGDIYVESKRGDRLDLLASKYYGDARLWYIIALSNNLGKGTFIVPTGIRLRIPSKVTVDQI